MHDTGERAAGGLPGFGLTLGYTMVYLSLIVLIPLSAVFIRSFGLGGEHFWES
jgi:sulfate/thiosulfate transport system permease protein